jgi:hypothetical protein
VERDVVPALFGFDIIHSPARKASLHEQLVLVKIETAPLQRGDLANTKTQTLSDFNHRAIWLAQCRDNEVELFHRQRSRALRRLLPPLIRTRAMGLLRSVNSSQRVAHSNIRCITAPNVGFVFGAIGRLLNQSSTAMGRCVRADNRPTVLEGSS